MDYAKETARLTDSILGAKRKPLPASEDDGELVFGEVSLPVTVRVYGNKTPRFPGNRETPEEPSFFDIDDVTIGGRSGEVSIYAALSDDDLHGIAESVMESYE